MVAARGRLHGTPILAWAALMAVSMGLAPVIAPVLAPMRKTSTYSHRDVTVALRDNFYGIPWLDMLCAEYVTAFSMLQFHSDSRFYWGTLDFITQYGSVYAFLLIEASRPSYSKRMLFWSVDCDFCSNRH